MIDCRCCRACLGMFQPTTPTLGTQFAARNRVFGTFFLWNRRF